MITSLCLSMTFRKTGFHFSGACSCGADFGIGPLATNAAAFQKFQKRNRHNSPAEAKADSARLWDTNGPSGSAPQSATATTENRPSDPTARSRMRAQ